MIRLLLKFVSLLLALITLAIIAFIKLLPWAIAVATLLTLVKLGHAWLARQGFITPGAWWPSWKGGESSPQNAA